MNTADLSVAVRVRKARRRSSCALCRGPIMTGQQISSSDGHVWTHVQCFIADRKERMSVTTAEYSYGEVGHDPPVHVVEGEWQGPKQTSRAAAMNTSLCGKRLARRIQQQPTRHDLCRRCEELMTKAKTPAATPAPATPAGGAPPPESLMHDYEKLIVPMGKVFVDRSHAQQRNEQPGWVKDIADNFSWSIFNLNPVALSARPDGTYHIIDGQHRVAGATRAGHGPETPIHAHVWRDLTFEQEAALFVLLNARRHSVKPLDLFKAQVTAGYEDAFALDALLTVYGWRIGSAGREGNFAAVTTLRKIYNKRSGPDVCDKIIATITKAWGHNSEGAHQIVIKVLAAFWGEYPSAEIGRLSETLARKMPTAEILIGARLSGVAATVSQLQDRYDSGLRDQKRRLKPPRG